MAFAIVDDIPVLIAGDAIVMEESEWHSTMEIPVGPSADPSVPTE